MTSDNRKKTDNLELVETYNITLALRRMKDAPQYDSDRCKRALVHAIGMAEIFSYEEKQNIRTALRLP